MVHSAAVSALLSSSSFAALRCAQRSALSFAPRPLRASASASPSSPSSASSSREALLRRDLLCSAVSGLAVSRSARAATEFFEIQGSGGVKALDLRIGEGDVPADGDQVAIHYYGRLAAKRGWRFDSTYDHKDEMGDPMPFVFLVGSNKVISGINAAVRTMKVGGIRRIVVPPSQGYKNTSQEPVPPNVSTDDLN